MAPRACSRRTAEAVTLQGRRGLGADVAEADVAEVEVAEAEATLEVALSLAELSAGAGVMEHSATDCPRTWRT